MDENDLFDVLVIGAGQAAMPLIFDLAQSGKKVALAERKNLGGSCVNFGCTPTKAVLASARVAHLARRAKEFGLMIPTVEVDFRAVMDGARAVVAESRDGLGDEFKDIDNPILIRGHARIEAKVENVFRVRIGDDRVVMAREVVLDTGTRALIPHIDGLDKVSFLTADNWIDLSELPQELILLGGGIIGLEMSQFYQRMGSKVTVIDINPRLLPHEEPEAAEMLQPILEAEGVKFVLGAKVTTVATTDEDGVRLTFERDGKVEEVIGTHLFVASGRQPNTADLGLETVGVKVDDKGIVGTDEKLMTNVEGIWVAGDIRGGPMFTHTSWDDYRILKSWMIGDKSQTLKRLVPYALFTDPNFARVGVTEKEAREAGTKIGVGVYDMVHNGRARETREKKGFAKVIIDTETDRLIGATVVSDEAAELVQIYSTLMNADAPYTVLRDRIYIHPTFAEGIQGATENVK